MFTIIRVSVSTGLLREIISSIVEIVLLLATIIDVFAWLFDIFVNPREFEIFPSSAKLVVLLNTPVYVRSEF
jgi:hypothetical protein